MSEVGHGETILTAIISAVGGGSLTKLASLVLARESRQVKALGETIRIMSDQQSRFDQRLQIAEDKVDDCEAKHESCERGREEDRREIDGLKHQIDRLIGPGGKIPAYHLNAPKGDPGRGEGK